MKKTSGIFVALLVVGFLGGCAAIQSRLQGDSQIAAALEPPQKELESDRKQTAEVTDAVALEPVGNDESQYDKKFADWTIKKVTDPIRAESQVLACSRFYQENNDRGDSQLCLRFYDKDFVVVEPQGVSGKGYWPYCEYDHIPYRVDENGPSVVPTIKSGLCGDDLDTTKEHFIQELKRGKTLYAQLNSSRGRVQLDGFGSAWDYATGQF